tara:strand:+ start:2728 stop:3336 length:609 start_codon:yes stop_codon:yes gene_type:complete
MGVGQTTETAGILSAAAKAAIGGGIIGGGLAAVPAVAGMMSAGGRAHRRQLGKDLEKLKAGKLGFSQAEKRQMAGEAARGLQSQSQTAAADLRRQAEASGGFGRSGAYQKGLAEIYKGGQGQLGEQMGEIEKLSTQKALQEKQRILQAAKEQRDKVASDWGRVVGGATAVGGALYRQAKAEEKGTASKYSTGSGEQIETRTN